MRVKIGYLRNIYINCGELVNASIRAEHHLLISGMTGTGKTTLLWYYLYNLINQFHQEGRSLKLNICDYKQEFHSLYGCARYYSEVEDIVTAIDQFYVDFYNARGSLNRNENNVLVIDEHLSFIAFLEAMSKTDKRYKEIFQRVTVEITSILAMGRSMGYTLVCILQQASAKNFSSTADRENFGNKIAMGTQTVTSASMIFDSSDTEMVDYRKAIPVGCGFLSVQGEPVQEIIVPQITNPDILQKRVRENLETM